MARTSKQKACIACTGYKRRCDKGLPSCTRCDDRDIDCHYPPTKRRRRDLQFQEERHEDPAVSAPTAAKIFALDAGPLSASLWSTTWTDLALPTDLQPVHSRVPDPPQSPTSATRPQATGARSHQQRTQSLHPASRLVTDNDLTESEWFLAPSTWRIRHWPAPPRIDYPTSVLTNFTRGMQAWVLRWVLQGHNPFVHRNLYARDAYFPSCLQDAFTSVSLYHHKTPQNENLVHRILDERVTALMASQPVGDDSSLSVPLLETRDHLARVHALFVYTIFRLFDGSVSQRAAAEVHLPTLSLWCRQLWDSAALDADTLSTSLVPHPSRYCPNTDPASSPKSQDVSDNREATSPDEGPSKDDYDSDLATWNLWVLSESIRRTWLIVTCTIGVYTTLKGDWPACPGGALFTARAGLWDAPSAPRWAALCREVAASSRDTHGRSHSASGNGSGGNFGGGGALFITPFHCEGLFRDAAAIEVDEFARHLCTVTWGLDRVDNWAIKTAHAGEVCLTY